MQTETKQSGGNDVKIHRRHFGAAMPASALAAAGVSGVMTAAAVSSPHERASRSGSCSSGTHSSRVMPKTVDGICAKESSYSHSYAHIESKAAFIETATVARRSDCRSDTTIRDP
jgi:hypothetical protein